MARGSHGSTHVQKLQGRRGKWDDWREIQRVNPLTRISAEFREVLREERAAARVDSRLKAAFLSFRLNVPTEDETAMLLTVDEWQRVTKRWLGKREGAPVVGLDLGGGRAWSAAVGMWPSGRVEAIAVAPGVPDLAEQERWDRVPRGIYQRLAAAGVLRVAPGLRVPPVGMLVELVADWHPRGIVCDRFRLPELQDCNPPCPVKAINMLWSEQTQYVRALRREALDGSLSVAPGSRKLLTASLSVALVEHDTSGNTRLKKRGTNNEARDDVAAALLLAVGVNARVQPVRRKRFAFG